jgi:hypothetical protein
MIFQGPTFVYASSMHDILARLIFVRALPLNAGFLIFDGALLLDARVRNFDRGLQLKAGDARGTKHLRGQRTSDVEGKRSLAACLACS